MWADNVKICLKSPAEIVGFLREIESVVGISVHSLPLSLAASPSLSLPLSSYSLSIPLPNTLMKFVTTVARPGPEAFHSVSASLPPSAARLMPDPYFGMTTTTKRQQGPHRVLDGATLSCSLTGPVE